MARVSIPSMPIFRPDFAYSDHCYHYSSSYFEKRQAFLRSYQFSRKKGIAERIRLSLARAKRVVWRKLRSFRRVRRTMWLRLRNVVVGRGRFHRLLFRPSPSDYFCPSSSFSCWTKPRRKYFRPGSVADFRWPQVMDGRR
ncbi:unnamed protein product [Victoria cruziana]